MSTAPAKAKFTEEELEYARSLNLSPERVAELSHGERLGYERKAARRNNIRSQGVKAPAGSGPQVRRKAERLSEVREAEAGVVPLIMLAKRRRSERSQDGSLQRIPGEIIPLPDSEDMGMLDGAAEPLEQWWGGELPEPRRIDGLIYPALQQRPAEGSIFVRDSVTHLTLLKDCEPQLACQAIVRCRDRELLSLVAQSRDRVVRASAEAALSSDLSNKAKEPVLLMLAEGELQVLRAGGELAAPIDFSKEILARLVQECEDVQALMALQEDRYLRQHHGLADERVKGLLASQAEAARIKREAEELARQKAEAQAQAEAAEKARLEAEELGKAQTAEELKNAGDLLKVNAETLGNASDGLATAGDQPPAGSVTTPPAAKPAAPQQGQQKAQGGKK